nr:DUF5906 domain-containing protein [uncultured Fluviicola sp.]
MKLLEQYQDKYQALFNKGFRFNPEEKILFQAKGRKQETPEEFENWEVVEFDKDEYLNERLEELGIDPEHNKVDLFDESNGRAKTRGAFGIFTANEFGDIEILQYSLTRKPYTYKTGETSAGPREECYCQRRLNPMYADFCKGKYDYKDGIVTPFWHPWLIDLYECKNQDDEGNPIIQTLFITEGQIKSFKACHDKIPMVGLTSISHFRDKQNGKIHREIVMFIQACNIKNVVILWDGDCRDISIKDLENNRDLTRRPRDFYKYACEIQEMTFEYFPKQKIQYYFATINKIETDEKAKSPKGIDDLLLYLGKPDAVKEEVKYLGEIPGRYLFFQKINNDIERKKLNRWFKLDKVTEFYRFHQDRIGNRKFIYYGSTYEIKEGHPVISIPADMKSYMRIGVSYYKIKKTPVPVGKSGDTVLEDVLEPWTSDAIKMDHGKDMFHQIQRFEGFTNIANHTNYQQVIDGHWNLYADLKHQKREGDYPTIKNLLKHLFGERFENGMILDYLTILYRYPMQKLPIIVLASPEQNTGKSTFINLVKMIFKSNMSIIGAKDFLSDFTAGWVSKLVVACEETMFDKASAYDVLKNMTTSETITRNEKNKAQTDIPNMMHFIMATNHDETFVRIDENDSRLWIEKVGRIKGKNPRFKEMMRAELPELINDLESREIIAPESDRLWFDEDSYKTDAFYNLVKRSEPEIVREMRERFRDAFLKFGVSEIKMTADDIRSHFGIRATSSTYINQCAKQFLKVERAKNSKGEEYVTTYSFPIDSVHETGQTIDVKGKGRPFVFPRELFLTEQELYRLENSVKPTKKKVKGESIEYKFRAECEADAMKFFGLLPSALETAKIVGLTHNKHKLPDVEVSFECNLSLKELRKIMNVIVDGHVMMQTIEEAANYTSERNYSI